MIVKDVPATLQESLLAAKERLRATDESLVKYLGQNESSAKQKADVLSDDANRFISRTLKRNLHSLPDNATLAKRIRPAPGSVFSRLNQGDARELITAREDLGNADRKQLTSTVVLPETRTREEAIKELEAQEDRQVRERNKRMFGMMLGTLQKFVSSEKEKEQLFSVQKRKEIEQKVEEGVDQEKEVLRKERAELLKERKSFQAEVSRLEAQVRLVKLFETWKANVDKMRGSIRTIRSDNAGHHIFYKPKVMCKRALARQRDSDAQLNMELEVRKQKLDAEVTRALNVGAANVSEDSQSDHDSAEPDNATHKKLLSSVSVVREIREMSSEREDSPVAQTKLGSVVQHAPTS